MFTGIIDHTGTVVELTQSNESIMLWIATQFTDLVLGESIAVNGICLTVNEIKDSVFQCDISPETLSVTTAKHFAKNAKVNVERALTLGARLGGHMVSGHVDCVATVKSINTNAEFTEIYFSNISADNMSFITKKGSIAVNGVSLTINDVTENGFAVMLIPHTLAVTTLSQLQIDNEVNIEFDMMVKVIVEQCKRYLSSRI